VVGHLVVTRCSPSSTAGAGAFTWSEATEIAIE
jgi:hypothetical protein